MEAECSVVCIPWLAGDPSALRLSLFKSRRPLHPVVLVTRGDIENARGLKDLPVEEVVWLGELERELEAAVGRTCLLRHTRSIASALDSARDVPVKLRAALALAARSERPIRTVDKLASAVGCDRRTLWRQWRQLVGEGAGLHLQDFLHWLLLLRAVGRKTPGVSWSEVAERVGVHPDTLGRLSRQLAGVALRDLAAGGEVAVADRFRDGMLRFILPDKLHEIGHSSVVGAKGKS